MISVSADEYFEKFSAFSVHVQSLQLYFIFFRPLLYDLYKLAVHIFVSHTSVHLDLPRCVAQDDHRLDASVIRNDIALSEEQGLSETYITGQNP